MAPPSGALITSRIGAEHLPEFARALSTDVEAMIFGANPVSKLLFSGKFAGRTMNHDGAAQLEMVVRTSTRSNIVAVINGQERPRTNGGAGEYRHRAFPTAPLFKGDATLTYAELEELSLTAERAAGGQASIVFMNNVLDHLADSQEDLRRRFTKWFVRGSLQSDPEEADAEALAQEALDYQDITRTFTLWGGNAAIGLTTWHPDAPKTTLAQGGLLQFQAPESQTGHYAGLYRKGDGGATTGSRYWYNQYALCNGPDTLALQLRRMRQAMTKLPKYEKYKFPTMALADNRTVEQLLEYHKSRLTAIGNKAVYEEIDKDLYGDVETSFRMPVEGGGTLDVLVPPELDFDSDDDIQTLRGVIMLPNIATFITINSWAKMQRLIQQKGLPWLTPTEGLNNRAFLLSDFFQPNVEEELWKSMWYMSHLHMAEELAFNGAINGTANIDASA